MSRSLPSFVLRLTIAVAAVSSLVFLASTGCGKKDESAQTPERPEVVIYSALDQEFSETILNAYASTANCKVKAVYDTESNKSVGLTSRILLERQDPQCDLFWNNEIVNTIRLQRDGALKPLPESLKIAPGLRGGTHYRAFAARARVVAIRADALSKFKDYAASDLTNRKLADGFPALERWPETGAFPDGVRIAIAHPFAGTTATHIAIMRSELGADRFNQWLDACKSNPAVTFYASNRQVVLAVNRGDADVCVTDTDDVFFLGPDLAWFPVATFESKRGALVIPNTLSFVNGGPNPSGAEALAAHIVSAETEALLANGPSKQLPLNPDVEPPAILKPLTNYPAGYLSVDWERAVDEYAEAVNEARKRLE